MSIIIEDGTGKIDAESYVDVAFVKSYHSDRDIDITVADLVIESHLRLATEYMDLRWGPVSPGLSVNEDQALIWPKVYFTLPLPLQLLRACAIYTQYSITNSLFIDNDNAEAGILEQTEQIGPIIESTKYSGAGLGSNGPKYPKVTKADQLMKLITIGSSQGGVIR